MALTATVNRQSNDELDVSLVMDPGDTADAYTFPAAFNGTPSISVVPTDGSFFGQSIFESSPSRTGFTLNKTQGVAAQCRAFIQRAR